MQQEEDKRALSDLPEYRTSSDYNDFFIISRDEVRDQIDGALGFLEAVKAFLAE